MFEVLNIERLAQELGVDVLAKVVFSFSPDIVMSPLALPREILHPWVDEILDQLKGSGALRDTLVQLKTRPTFAEQWPDIYNEAVVKGKQRMLQLEKIRTCSINMEKILSQRPAVAEWWRSINV
jgi:hypothetical protein